MGRPCRHDPLGREPECKECFPPITRIDLLRDEEHVDHPAHYGGADNPYEAIKVIEAWELGFCLGNTVKYISRAGKKNRFKEAEDLRKARWYLDRRIEQLDGAASNGS